MARPSHPTKRRAFAELALRTLAVAVAVFVVVNTFVLEVFHVPTGSMAPALCGNHRVGTCPRCGHGVVVGRAPADVKGSGDWRYYQKAFCQNCGHCPLPLDDTIELPGDKVLVNRAAYHLRAPRRWEIAVFELFGIHFIKRLLGLPGESVRIHDGDVYIDGKLCRKSHAEARAMRVLLSEDGGQAERWELVPASAAPLPRSAEGALLIDGRMTPRTVSYRHDCWNADKCEPIRDEYAYNGGVHDSPEEVHDFLIDAEVELTAGKGTLGLRLCDGRDWVEVVLPAGEGTCAEVFAWSVRRPDKVRKLADIEQVAPLRAGHRHRVEVAFVDRRLSLAVDGHEWLQLDLPEVKRRDGVPMPVQLHAEGIRCQLHRFALSRDVHYGQQGKNAVKGHTVHLEAGQYFVLGDNSANSSDSRSWPDEGRVNADSLVGSVLWVQRSR